MTKFLRHPSGIAGLLLTVLIVLFCFAGPLFYHTNQVDTQLSLTNLGPTSRHILGTDQNGFDELGRLMEGGRYSLEIGFAVAILATMLGVVWGAIAGFAGTWIDAVMMRVVDTFLAIPAIFILIYLQTVFTPTVATLIFVLALLSWLGPSRLIRGDTLALRTREFVEASATMGARRSWIVVRHLIPNTIGTAVVAATFQLADAMIILATLSFLGFGLAPPAATWGGMLSQGTTYLLDGYWWEIYPAGVAIMLTVIAFNLLGDALRSTLDVRLRDR